MQTVPVIVSPSTAASSHRQLPSAGTFRDIDRVHGNDKRHTLYTSGHFRVSSPNVKLVHRDFGGDIL